MSEHDEPSGTGYFSEDLREAIDQAFPWSEATAPEDEAEVE